MQDIVALIDKSFSGLSGIIYCLSRRDCEVMAGELCKANIAGLCYHAGLSDEDRSAVQQRWVQGDRCKVSARAASILDRQYMEWWPLFRSYDPVV